MSATMLVFFACIGFDFITCLAEEVKNPHRDLPISISLTVLICTVVYVIISVSVYGMTRLEKFTGETALALAFADVGCDWMEVIIYISAFVGISGSAFTKLMSQPWIFYAYARDGLFFKVFADINPKKNVPVKGAWICCIFVCLVCFFLNLEELSKVISLGCLMNYCIINAGLIALRFRRPQEPGQLDIIRSKEEIYPFIYMVFAFIFGMSLG